MDKFYYFARTLDEILARNANDTRILYCAGIARVMANKNEPLPYLLSLDTNSIDAEMIKFINEYKESDERKQFNIIVKFIFGLAMDVAKKAEIWSEYKDDVLAASRAVVSGIFSDIRGDVAVTRAIDWALDSFAADANRVHGAIILLSSPTSIKYVTRVNCRDCVQYGTGCSENGNCRVIEYSKIHIGPLDKSPYFIDGFIKIDQTVPSTKLESTKGAVNGVAIFHRKNKSK